MGAISPAFQASVRDPTGIILLPPRIAGESLTRGDPVAIVGSSLYKASNLPSMPSKHLILGLCPMDCAIGKSIRIQLSGVMKVPYTISPGARYYLADKTLSSTPPSSGYLVPVGIGYDTDSIIIAIELHVLLFS